MNAPDRRWGRVDELYHEMLLRPPRERASALAAACPDDPDLLTEVQSLLDEPGSEAGFLVTPVLDAAARAGVEPHPSLTGRRIGVFEVQDLLAVGGMGEVYRAHDTKLGRTVAIKVLPEAFARDPERLARFDREARALASLNHPNIAVIHGIEELPGEGGSTPGSRALVMELVDGEDLSTRIGRGPLPSSEAVPIARQIAKALEAAHEHGIVHRDLKPANIKVRADGTVKVLDFGLAKVQPLSTQREDSAGFHAPTGDGAVMGTPGYMSPEQIRGQPVDWRSDLFAFGVVLYEMLTGRRAFAKGSDVETLHAALTEAPVDLDTMAPDTDPELTVAVTRCLEKRPEDRFQSAKDLGVALEALIGSPGPRGSASSPGPRWSLVAATVLTGLGVVGMSLLWNRPAGLPATYRQVTSDGHSVTGDLSPDGESIAYVSTDGDAKRLMVRDLSGGAPLEIHRVEEGVMSTPRWSHSGKFIAIASRNEVLVISRFGGVASRIEPRGGFRISWSPDDSELILGSAGAKWFWVASIQTRVVRRVEVDAPFGGYVTDISKDGERLLLFVWDETHGGVWSMKKDGTDLRQHVREKRRTHDARWAADGGSFYYLLAGANVAEVRRARASPDGPDPSPSIVQANLTIEESSAASISISGSGTLAYPRVSLDRNLWRADVSPSTTSQDPIPLHAVTNGSRSEAPRFSPDGAQIVFARKDGEFGQLLIASSEGRVLRTLVSRKGTVAEPAWSADGENVAYCLDNDDGRVLHVVGVTSGEDRAFKPVSTPASPEWAPDPRLLYIAPDLSAYSLDTATGQERPLVDPQEGAAHLFPRYSHRGDRVAMWYNARTKRGVVGLAIVSLRDRRLKVIPSTSVILKPIGWSADDAFVYVVDQATGQLVAVRSDGKGLRAIGSLPSRRISGDAVEIDGKLKLVLWYPNDRSDIWVVENFDGGRR